jgi:hypothetical protein
MMRQLAKRPVSSVADDQKAGTKTQPNESFDSKEGTRRASNASPLKKEQATPL